MFKKQSFQFPDEGGKFTTRVWEMPFTEDNEDFKTIIDKRYKSTESCLPEFNSVLRGEISLAKRK
ncbi:MAG: hypothetical protein MZV70_51165 [Desulfobacterales bacterium]|nr:hypothetical protein [Desulfosudis oleivorans]MCK7511596.1 hypothetical protein [Desulfobacterales bacterium]